MYIGSENVRGRFALLQALLKDELSEAAQYRIYSTLGDAWNFHKYVVTDRDSPFWDDLSTDEIETAQVTMRRALQHAIKQLEMDLGPDMEQWQWGRVHTLTLRHPFGMLPGLAELFNVGPFPVPAGSC